ncbi:MAG: protein HslO [Deltaproteobacteria bacterium RIFOXYD12_FULL_57_12]|nr:MAG: protein HslO [Deltaproteobacteria bacterium RIFOXYD12_FULL_57_12]
MIKKKPFGNTLKEQLIANAQDRLYSFVLAGQTVRGAVVNGVRMVNEMRANHELGILETFALGHAYLAAALLASSLKGNDVIGLKIDCSGPLKGLVVEANAFGEVRGYLKRVPIPVEKPLESFDLSPFLGAGFLTVTRYLEDAKQPFAGNVALQYGNIALDLAHYFLISEQLPTAINLSIQFDRDGEVIGAGGLLLQAMPGASQEEMAVLDKRVAELPSLGITFAKNSDARQLVADHFADFSPEFLADYRIEFLCRCNEGRIREILLALPEEERRDIVANGPFPLEIRCHNCNTPYRFGHSELATIFA